MPRSILGIKVWRAADEEGVYVQQDLGTGNLEYVRAKEFTHWMYLPEPPKEGEE